jgi:hypothetical protein
MITGAVAIRLDVKAGFARHRCAAVARGLGVDVLLGGGVLALWQPWRTEAAAGAVPDRCHQPPN